MTFLTIAEMAQNVFLTSRGCRHRTPDRGRSTLNLGQDGKKMR
jgi:hypothetical protein